MQHDRKTIEDAFHEDSTLKFLFFWGHQPSKDGSLGVSCFSQWWPSPFEVDGFRYPTAEHWMMAGKALLFGDEQTAAKIRAATSPKEAKQLGREVRGFDSARWDAEKRRIVLEGNLHKFSQNPALGEFLLSTGDEVIVEASPVDPVWGIGLAADDAEALNPFLWRGENLLGFALMDVRDRLRYAAL